MRSVELVRFFVCPGCGVAVPDAYVAMLRGRGKLVFNCPCGGQVSLAEPREKLRFDSQVEAMGRSADRQREFEMFVESARGETATPSFTEWAGGDRVTLAIVFTDIVDSVAMGQELGEEPTSEVRRAHFAQSRKLIVQFKGREVKTIGDSFMVAFKSADSALDFALALQSETGHSEVDIRAGIHIGPMQVREGDVFGGTVDFSARVIQAIEGAEIWLSDRAKQDIHQTRAPRHTPLQWARHDEVTMTGFTGTFTLWQLVQERVSSS